MKSGWYKIKIYRGKWHFFDNDQVASICGRQMMTPPVVSGAHKVKDECLHCQRMVKGQT